MITARESKIKKKTVRKNFGDSTGLIDCEGKDLCIGDKILFIRPKHSYNANGNRLYFARAEVIGSSPKIIRYAYYDKGKRRVASTKYLEKIMKL